MQLKVWLCHPDQLKMGSETLRKGYTADKLPQLPSITSHFLLRSLCSSKFVRKKSECIHDIIDYDLRMPTRGSVVLPSPKRYMSL
jgi:hypothetical protein